MIFMIVREFYMTREDGVSLYRTYSDTYNYIRKVETNEVYVDAVDVEGAPYTYEETEDVIEDYLKELLDNNGNNMDKMVEE